MKYLLLFIFFLSIDVKAYVHSINKHGELVHWSSSFTQINMYLNIANCNTIFSSCDSTVISNATSSAASQWSSASGKSISINTTSSGPTRYRNDIYFTSSDSYFSGGGVVAVTQVSFKENSGLILEADIVINSDYPYSDNSDEALYFGNIITHEMGHLLGLDHSQVFRSTMFYSLAIGQHTISKDDIAGVKTLYSVGQSSLGKISGKIIGGTNLTGIFGAHVQVVSASTGEVVASSLSGPDGTFSVNSISLNDVYHLYISPTKLASSTLHEYYSTIRGDFCNAGQWYRGSFFESCANSKKGHPQGIYLNSSNKSVDVGSVTIRCSFDTPYDYSINKASSSVAVDALDSSGNVGQSQTGYFTSAQMTSYTPDTYTVDLSDYIIPSGGAYLEVRATSQKLYSSLKAEMEIENAVGTTLTFPTVGELDGDGVAYDSDLAPRFDIVGRFALSNTVANNVFTVTITPDDATSFIAGVPDDRSDYFPNYRTFLDTLSFYLLSVHVVKANGDGTYSRIAIRNPDAITDNKSCPDANRSYAVGASVSSRNSIVSETKTISDKAALACGSIAMINDEDHGNDGSGPMSFVIGVLSIIFIMRSKVRISQLQKILARLIFQ